nr:hemolysin [uncultured Cupriavidus sp.]
MLKTIPIALLFASSTAHALVIAEAPFTKNGGDLGNIPGTITQANETLREQSYAKAWLAVGKFRSCTATWIGDDDTWSYFLTAARCVPRVGATGEFRGKFTAWNNRVVATGAGFAYIAGEEPLAAGRSPAADIALLKLPRQRQMVDKSGIPLDPPILDDSPVETGKPVIFIGYGGWGAGESRSPDLPSPQVPPEGSAGPALPSGQRPLYDSRSFLYHDPQSGARRLYGRSVLDVSMLGGRMVRAGYVPGSQSERWARLAQGDAGAPMWQIRGKRPVIVAVGTSNGGRESNGVPVSKWVGWIRSVYPGARFLSTVKSQGCIVGLRTGQTYCIEPGQRAAVLPEWVARQGIYVQADSGVSVELSGRGNRLATFMGTAEGDKLVVRRGVRAGGVFRRPESMAVTHNSVPLGCIVSLDSADKYCLPPGLTTAELPAWIKGHDVIVEAETGAAVMLSDVKNLAENRVAQFVGNVGNAELRKAQAYSGEMLDFSKPVSMRVVQH